MIANSTGHFLQVVISYLHAEKSSAFNRIAHATACLSLKRSARTSPTLLNTSPERPPFSVERQPTDCSCGPTCLAGIYRWFGLDVPLDELIAQVPSIAGGGTLAVLLGIDALRRKFSARLYSCNLRVLDPTWFPSSQADLLEKIRSSRRVRRALKERQELGALIEFLTLGGELRMETLTRELIRRHLLSNTPILTGLSATFLYRDARLHPETSEPDDLRGQPEGHFVVLLGYDRANKAVTVHDPWPHSPFEEPHRYAVHIDHLISAILLGVLTFDANLLVLRPPS